MNVKKLKADWAQACLYSHRGDLLRAKVGQNVYKYNKPDVASHLLRTHLGLSHAAVNKLRRMGEALKQVPDEDVWLAGGWSAVCLLLRLPPAKRTSARARLKAPGRQLGRDTAKKLIGPVPRSPRMGGRKRGYSPSTGVTADVLLDELARLLKRMPLIRHLLSEQVRDALDKRQRKAG